VGLVWLLFERLTNRPAWTERSFEQPCVARWPLVRLALRRVLRRSRLQLSEQRLLQPWLSVCEGALDSALLPFYPFEKARRRIGGKEWGSGGGAPSRRSAGFQPAFRWQSPPSRLQAGASLRLTFRPPPGQPRSVEPLQRSGRPSFRRREHKEHKELNDKGKVVSQFSPLCSLCSLWFNPPSTEPL
jgi:hypothetical protein